MTKRPSTIEEKAEERQEKISTAIRKNFMAGNIVLAEIKNIEISGISRIEYPEFESAHITGFDYNVIKADEEMINFLIETHPFFCRMQIENEANSSRLIL